MDLFVQICVCFALIGFGCLGFSVSIAMIKESFFDTYEEDNQVAEDDRLYEKHR